MEQVKGIVMPIVEFGTSPLGFALIFLIAFIYFGVPKLRLFFADVVEFSNLSVDEHELKDLFQIATFRPKDPDCPEEIEAYKELARLGEWDKFHQMLIRDDREKASCGDGVRIARVAVQVATRQIHEAIGHGGNGAEARASAAIEDFEARIGAGHDNLAAAVLAAEAHMEMGWLYRGDGYIDTVSDSAMDNMQFHFDAADEILRNSAEGNQNSPIWAAALFRLAVGLCDSEMRYQSARDIWMAADPKNPEMMAQVAFHTLPRWYGSHPELHRMAAKIADRSSAELGDQGYAITLLSVAVEEPDMVDALDVPRLIRGAMQMIEADGQDQGTINEVLAGMFYLMLNAIGTRRKQLRAALREILETKMKAWISDAWPDSLADIRGNLATLFTDELNSGGQISIDDQGFRLSMPNPQA